jgi:hypothetical protein
MPADKGPGCNDDERFFPLEKLGPEHQGQSCRVGQAARPNLVVLVVSQLLSQEQDFRCYGRLGAGSDVQELQSIPQQFPEDSKDGAEATLPNASR